MAYLKHFSSAWDCVAFTQRASSKNNSPGFHFGGLKGDISRAPVLLHMVSDLPSTGLAPKKWGSTQLQICRLIPG